MAKAAGLDLFPMSVLRCRGHPGNAAGPRSPPQRGPAAGPEGIGMRLHRSGPDPGPGASAAEGPAAPPGTKTSAHRHGRKYRATSQARYSRLHADEYRRVAHTAHTTAANASSCRCELRRPQCSVRAARLLI